MKYALIGCGRIAVNHIKAMVENGLEMVAVCDLVPEAIGTRKGLVFLRNGLYLGEIRKDRFEPSQSFAMALKKEEYTAVINLDYRDVRVEKYLRGETLEVDDIVECNFQKAEEMHNAKTTKKRLEKGWQLVCVNGYPLGWGKLSGGTLKNKYHPGWRMQV